MQARFGQIKRIVFMAAACAYLFSAFTAAASEKKSAGGSKAKIQGIVLSRDGNIVKVKEKKSGSVRQVNITDTTKIQRDKKLSDSQEMGVNALVPGLNVKVEGIANGAGEIEAKKIKLYPDPFSITIAQQEEILDNRAVASHAQASADDGIAKASTAQSSADKAQGTADQGLSTAASATALATANTAAVGKLNQRVTDLGQYDSVASVGVYFREGSSRLDKASKATLDQFVAANSSLNGYVVAIAGYTDSIGSQHLNQTLSERRAAAVAQYLREKANVPAWRIAVPAGYGETHPTADNSDREGRAKNRRVEVSVLVSKGLQQNEAVAAAANR